MKKRKHRELCGKPCLTGITEAARAMVCCREKGHAGSCGAWGSSSNKPDWWER